MLKSLFGKDPAPAPAQQSDPPRTFLQAYGDRTLQELFADWQEVELPVESTPWASFPPADFLEFCRSYPATPFGDIPESPAHLRKPTYLLSQAHRVWVTASIVHERLQALGARSFLDLGSFPFFLPFVLRDYFGFTGSITATANLPLAKEHLDFLAGKGIEVEFLDLDPFVRDPADPQVLPRSLEGRASRFDLALSSHVIEHLYHPRSMVQECRRLLRDGGEVVITTDNAMMLDVFQNYVAGYGYIFEPVQQTAAMEFSFWRGHVRFFTESDLRTIVERCGFTHAQTRFFHCFYDVFFPEFFRQPVPRLQQYKARMLAQMPSLRNDITVIARK